MRIGKWLIRVRVIKVGLCRVGVHRGRYPEGSIYLIRLGLLTLKASVDCMTEERRKEIRRQVQALVSGWREDTEDRA